MLSAKLAKLTPAQRKLLGSLTEEWRREEYDWKATDLFHRMQDEGYCEMKDVRVSGGDISTGPGNTSVYRWHTRRTQAGTSALAGDFSRRVIEKTQEATR